MKLKEGFLLRNVAGQAVVLPMGGTVDLNTMITLNETGAFLWERLEQDTDKAALVAALLAEFDVDEATAAKSVDNFIAKLNDHGFLAK